MPKTDPVGVPLKASIDVDALADSLEKQMKEKMKSWSVVIDAPYALSLEFGTRGAESKGPKTRKIFYDSDGNVTERWVTNTFYSLYLWAARRTGDPKDAFRLASATYHNVIKNGLAPHPFIRPALHDVEDHIEEYMKQASENYDDPIEGLAHILADKIKDNINGQDVEGLRAPDSDLGVLKNSIYVVKADGPVGNNIDWKKDIHSEVRGPL